VREQVVTGEETRFVAVARSTWGERREKVVLLGVSSEKA